MLLLLLLLMLLLSQFSRVQLYVTPYTAAHQAPPSLGFSRQEHWTGLPFPSPVRESEVAQSCPTLSNPMGCSLPGSSIHGIFQTRVLEWGAIAFSEFRWVCVNILLVGKNFAQKWLLCLYFKNVKYVNIQKKISVLKVLEYSSKS